MVTSLKPVLSKRIGFIGGATLVALVIAFVARDALIESRMDRVRLLAKENAYAMQLSDLPTNNMVFGVQLLGSSAFRLQIARALLLLKVCDPDAFARVTNAVGIVREDLRSVVWVTNQPPLVTISSTSALYSLTWCAAGLAHEARHVEFARRDGTSVKAVQYNARHRGYKDARREELECMRFEIKVLERIGAPNNEVRHVKSQNGLHFDVNRDGKLDWEDFRAQDW